MNEGRQPVAAHENRATMLWDGDCSFCYRWIQRWKKATGEAVDYRPYQEALENFPQISEADCVQAVQLVLPDGRVLKAAHAVLQSLALAGKCCWMLRLYQRSGFFRRLTETAYRFVARNRAWLPR